MDGQGTSGGISQTWLDCQRPNFSEQEATSAESVNETRESQIETPDELWQLTTTSLCPNENPRLLVFRKNSCSYIAEFNCTDYTGGSHSRRSLQRCTGVLHFYYVQRTTQSVVSAIKEYTVVNPQPHCAVCDVSMRMCWLYCTTVSLWCQLMYFSTSNSKW